MYYYYAGEEKTMVAWPAGLRMITGNSTSGFTQNMNVQLTFGTGLLRSNQKTDAQNYGAINFACLGSEEVDTPYLPQYCAGGLRADLFFPSCWNGKDIDSTNHTSHVAYSSNVETGGSDGEGDYGSTLPGNGKW